MFYDQEFYIINLSQFQNNNKPSPKTIKFTVTEDTICEIKSNSVNKTNLPKPSPQRVSNKKYPFICHIVIYLNFFNINIT